MRPVHFEIQADDPARCSAFYSEVFGWKIAQWEKQEYWLITTGEKGTPGIDGGILPRHGKLVKDAGINAFVCTIEVADYDTIHDKILAAGGVVALPKFAFPGMAWQGYYKDTEGNIFGIHHPDTHAK